MQQLLPSSGNFQSISDEDLTILMDCDIIWCVLEQGFNHDTVRETLCQKLEQTGLPYFSVDECINDVSNNIENKFQNINRNLLQSRMRMEEPNESPNQSLEEPNESPNQSLEEPNLSAASNLGELEEQNFICKICMDDVVHVLSIQI